MSSPLPPPLPPVAPASTPPARGWWQRHWKWALPLAVVTAFVLFLAAVTAFVFAIRASMLASEVYVDAVARAHAHPEVAATLGTPITNGFMPLGSVGTSTESGGSGRADLRVMLEGPRGNGTLFVGADRTRGTWIYETLLFVPDGTGDGGVVRVVEAGTPIVQRREAMP